MRTVSRIITACALASVIASSASSASTVAGAATAIPRTSGVLTIGGTPHPYLAEGRGLTCIVVGLAPMYQPAFTDRLKERIRFIFIDWKNSWNAESPAGVQKITLDSLVEEVEQARTGLGLEKTCLVGHSAPGLVAVEYALRHPDRVSQMILVGVEPYFTPDFIKARTAFWDNEASAERKAAYRKLVERIPDDLLKRVSPRDSFALRYVRNGPRYFFDPSYDFYWGFAGKQFSAELVTYFLNTIVGNYDPRPRLTKNTVPTLLVLGRYDYNIPFREWDSARKATPNLTSHVFEKSAHFAMIEEPDLFDDTVMRWLTAQHVPEY